MILYEVNKTNIINKNYASMKMKYYEDNNKGNMIYHEYDKKDNMIY